MTPSVTDLYQLQSDFLAACETAVASSPGGAIARSYVSPGIPAMDCAPEMCVYLGGPMESNTLPLAPPLQLGRRSIDDDKVNMIRMVCCIFRCTPVPRSDGTPPTPAQIEDVAKLTSGDIWAVWNVVPALYRQGAVFRRPDGEPRELFWDPAIPVNQMGGVGGWMIPIRVTLDGYRPVIV